MMGSPKAIARLGKDFSSGPVSAGPFSFVELQRSHDAFDAVIAALTARAASLGQTCPPGEDDLAAARTEGWIAIPSSPISQLI